MPRLGEGPGLVCGGNRHGPGSANFFPPPYPSSLVVVVKERGGVWG